MRPHDVKVLLEDAVAEIHEPEAAVDLASRVWADATAIRRRRRRRTGMVVSAGIAGLVAAAVIANPRLDRSAEQVAPSPEPVPSPVVTVARAGQINGAPYWIGPAAGSEAWLDRIPTALGDRLTVPTGMVSDLKQRPVRRIAAVLLRRVPGAQERYRPMLLSVSGRWAESSIELVPTQDSEGKKYLPLAPTAVSPSDGMVAFAQPNSVVVLESATGISRRIPVPSATIRNVSWAPTGDRLLVSGDRIAFRVIVGVGAAGEQTVEQVAAPSDPRSMTSPLALDRDPIGETLISYDVEGRRKTEHRPKLPVAQWWGSTSTAGALAARAFEPDASPQLLGSSAGIAVVEAHPSTPAKLLALPDGADVTRESGCCQVMGWWDPHTVLFESRTSGDDWLLAWNVLTGQVRRVAELGVDVLALGPTLVR